MTVELTMLVFSVGLLLVILLGQGTLGVLSNGLAAQAGPRDGLPGPSVVHARVTRLRANMIENLLLFAPIVLVAHAVGMSNETTILGAQLFFGARLAHAIIYMAGWPWIRPVAFAVALVGTLMIASQLFG
ncbi:MAG: putative MAPEG superfamily protein [Candidatus Azotimanducaceae bacterium]|jgi:uncharacterized MAPEG superfamily protein